MRRRLGFTALALAGAAALAACTSSGAGSTAQAPPISVGSSSAATSAVPTDSAPATPPSTSASAPVSSTAAPSTSASASASTPPGPPACTTAQLAVRVLRGGAIAGQELAGITFTNSSSTTCSLFGYPGVSLLLGGAPLGKPAERSATPPAQVTLRPGEQAETKVTVFSTCNAPLSDTIRVYPPNLTSHVDRPMQLRGCRMAVDPVSHS